MCLGLSANELLPGVKLAKEDEPSLSPLLPEITSRLAAAGELSAMVELAERRSEEGEVGQAVELLVRAVRVEAEATDGETLAGCTRYQATPPPAPTRARALTRTPAPTLIRSLILSQPEPKP